MKNKIFSIFKNNILKKTNNQPKIEYFNVNLFNANQFKLTSCFFFN